MNDRWNLEPLFKGFDDPAYEAGLTALQEKAAELKAFAESLAEADPLEALRRGIRLQEDMNLLVDRLAAYPSLRQAANTRDNEAASMMGRVRTILSATAAPRAAFQEWAGKLANLMELVEADDQLRPYRFYFERMSLSGCYLLPGNGEEIMARMGMSGSGAWGSMRGFVTSTAKVHYRGGVTNLSAIRNLAKDPDSQVRKEAYEAELAACEAIQDPIAHAMNAIKLETISECALRGHASPLDASLHGARMSRRTLEAMFGAIDEYLPKFRQYLRAKAKLLGHEGGLPWYDLFAPIGKGAQKTYSAQEARDYLVKTFRSFDPEMAEMMGRAFDEAWIDIYPRDGKRDGAFCSSVRSMGRSWIMTNFDGSIKGLGTFAHELGHAWHNQCIREHLPLNKSYSMPVAETASTFNECVFYSAAMAAAETREEKLDLMETHLQNETQIIVDIYSRFRFEDEVFRQRPTKFLNAQALCAIMAQAQLDSYGDGLDPEILHPYMWLCKPHYYGSTYYNYPYAFGGLFARGLYAMYLREGEAFLPKYRKLLYTTTVATVEDTALVAGIDLGDKDFWRSALQAIADDIDTFCRLAEEM